MDYIYSYLNDDVASREMHGSETNTAVVTVNAATNTISVDVKPISPSMLNVTKPTETGSYILQETISAIGEVSYSWATLEDYNQEVTQAIANLTQQLEQEKQERIESVQAEANTRELADTQLRTEFTSEIAQEKQEREQAISEEAQRTNSMINQLNDNVQEGFNTINNVLTTSINSINNAILNESTVREEQYQDTEFRIRDLNTRLGVEIDNRESWDAEIYANLSADIANEKRERVEQDQDIRNSISAEANLRQEAFDELSNKISSEANRTDNMINQLNNNVQEGFNILNTVLIDSINTINGGIEEERQTRATADETLQSNIDAEANERKSVDQHLWDILPDNIIAGTPMQGMENANAINIVFSKYQKHGIGEDPADAELVEVPNQAITLFPATQEVAGVLTAADKTKIDNIATDIKTAVQAETNRATNAENALDKKINTTKNDILGDVAESYNTLGKLEDAIQDEATARDEADTAIHNEIDAIDTRVENLEGKTTRLFYEGEVNPPSASDINTWVTGLDVEPKYEAPFEGIAVVVLMSDETYHIWHYYSNLSNWRDDGVDTVSTFTNDKKGIIQGSTNDGYVAAENGIGKVSGWNTVKTDITNLQNNLSSNVSNINNSISNINQNVANIANDLATNVVTLGNAYTQANNAYTQANTAYSRADEAYNLASVANTLANTANTAATIANNAINSHIANKENPHDVNATQVGLGNVKNIDTTNASNINSGTLAKNIIADGLIVSGNSSTTTVIKNSETGAYTVTAIVNKENVGLGNVDNTSDLDKPVSTATNNVFASVNACIAEVTTTAGNAYSQANEAMNIATNANTNIANHIANVNNPHKVTKAQLGLSNVPNVDTTNASNINSGTLAINRIAEGLITNGTNVTVSRNSVSGVYTISAVAGGTAPVNSVNGETGDVVLDKADIGLGNVDNVQQYSVDNPPPYPVKSVAGKTGAVTLSNLTFTGACEATYNGASAVLVEIPTVPAMHAVNLSINNGSASTVVGNVYSNSSTPIEISIPTISVVRGTPTGSGVAVVDIQVTTEGNVVTITPVLGPVNDGTL